MSFLAPIWLAAAGAAALGVVSLHFITTQRPPASPLPTARFVPPGDARASSRAARPTDLLLLLLRCAAVLLLGAAFAGPVVAAGRTTLSRVILVDRSRSTLADARDSALAVWHEAGARAAGSDAVIAFDSAANAIMGNVEDSLRALSPSGRRGSLTAALVGARRAAGALALRADSIELVIVSPLTADEIDAASAPTLLRWPGRVRLVRTRPAMAPAATVALAPDSPEDPLRPLIAALNAVPAKAAPHAAVRAVRGVLSAADSAAARSGAAVVSWPLATGAAAVAEGVWAGSATLVAPLARLTLPPGGRVIARWADGAPAASESALGSGCVREVGVGVPAAGDVSIQPAFMSLARVLLAPCGGGVAFAVPDSTARVFAKGGTAAAAAALRGSGDRSPVAPWLIGAALLLLAAETFLRRGAPVAS